MNDQFLKLRSKGLSVQYVKRWTKVSPESNSFSASSRRAFVSAISMILTSFSSSTRSCKSFPVNPKISASGWVTETLVKISEEEREFVHTSCSQREIRQSRTFVGLKDRWAVGYVSTIIIRLLLYTFSSVTGIVNLKTHNFILKRSNKQDTQTTKRDKRYSNEIKILKET